MFGGQRHVTMHAYLGLCVTEVEKLPLGGRRLEVDGGAARTAGRLALVGLPRIKLHGDTGKCVPIEPIQLCLEGLPLQMSMAGRLASKNPPHY